MMPPLHLQSIAELAVGRTLNGVVEGLLIAFCGWVLLRAMRQHSSNTRFTVLLVILAAVVSMPIIQALYWRANVASATHSALLLPASWATDIFLFWGVVAAAGLVKIALGFWQLLKLHRSCTPVNANYLQPDLRATLNANRARRRVQICVSDRVRVPAAIGFLRPAIVIPAWALEELTPAELNAVVLHELAHLRRWDDWTNLVQKIVGALLFFHPAVWWIGRELAREREMACDDFVLATTADHRGYAKCLVSVAEKSFLRRGLALAQALVERMQLTAQRVARILQGAHAARKPATNVWKPALAFVTAVSAICIVSLAHEPNLVAFDNGNAAGTAIAEIGQNFDAKVIPAKFVVGNAVVRDPGIPKTYVEKHVARHHAETALLAANTQQGATRKPAQLLNTHGQESLRAVPAHTVLVIMQSNEVDAYGRVWSVSMWQLTIYHPDRNVVRPSQKGVPPKST